MLTFEGCRARRSRLLKAIGDDQALVLINDPLYVFYLTNLWISPNSLNAYGPCWLIIKPDGETILLIDNFTKAQAQCAHVDRVEMTDWYTQQHAGGNRAAALNQFLIELLRKENLLLPKAACCFDSMPHMVTKTFHGEKQLEPSYDVTPILDRMRRAKDPDELEFIKRCIKIGEAILEASWAFVKPGMTEADLYCSAHSAALAEAGEPIVMRCGITPSPRPKNGNGSLVLSDGMLVILDMFPLFNGYRCDITNTLCVGGHPTRRQQELFNLCKFAMAAGEAMLRPGVKASAVYAAVYNVFKEAGEGALFPHHAGHAIGLGHPEPPFLIPADDEPLVENSVFTLEPGLYDAEAGGMRIEHNYLVTANGPQKLSNHRIALM